MERGALPVRGRGRPPISISGLGRGRHSTSSVGIGTTSNETSIAGKKDMQLQLNHLKLKVRVGDLIKEKDMDFL